MSQYDEHHTSAPPECRWCGGDRSASPSEDFCREPCQQAWHAAQIGAEPPADPSPPRAPLQPEPDFQYPRTRLAALWQRPGTDSFGESDRQQTQPMQANAMSFDSSSPELQRPIRGLIGWEKSPLAALRADETYADYRVATSWRSGGTGKTGVIRERLGLPGNEQE